MSTIMFLHFYLLFSYYSTFLQKCYFNIFEDLLWHIKRECNILVILNLHQRIRVNDGVRGVVTI